MTVAGRSPQGECGLKFQELAEVFKVFLSLPARGVWIEMTWMSLMSSMSTSLPARGVWIEIPGRPDRPIVWSGRSPQGV